MNSSDRATVTIKSKYRDLKANGKGIEAYRMLADMTTTGPAQMYWASTHPDALSHGSQFLPRDKTLASSRHASCEVSAPIGMLVIEIKKHVSPRGDEGVTYRAGWLIKDGPIDWMGASSYLPVSHCGVKRLGPKAYVHVVQIGFKKFELQVAGV